jgi:hypothetical protein
MHTGSIAASAIDSKGQILVTGGKGKTIRLWNIKSGQLLKVLRPPIAPNEEGEIYSLSISPDGSSIAAGGHTGYTWDRFFSVYIFDRLTGKLFRPPIALSNVITSLAYSSDGKYLAIGMADAGLRVYRTDRWILVGKDEEYYGSITSLTWTRDNKLISAATGYLALYRFAIGSQQVKRRYNLSSLRANSCLKIGTNPTSISIAPGHGSIAVGFGDSAQALVIENDKDDLKVLFCTKSLSHPETSLEHVAWSFDGETLFGGGVKIPDDRKAALLAWNQRGRGAADVYPLASRTHVTSVTSYTTQAGVLVTLDPPALGVIDTSGKYIPINPSPLIHVDEKSLSISPEGETIELLLAASSNAGIRFSLRQRELTVFHKGKSAPGSVKGSDKMHLKLGDGINEPPSVNGTYLPLGPEEGFSSWAIDPHHTGFALASNKYLRLFDSKGAPRWPTPVSGTFRAVQIPDLKEVVIAVLGDGTIRWYGLQDGRELLALFIHADLERWVLWTPSGYYEASPGGEELVGWHVNRAENQVADFFPVSRFRANYYRPDIVNRILDETDEQDAIRLANEVSERPPQIELTRQLPPVINIIYPSEGDIISTQEVTIEYTVRTPSGEPITGITALLDGRLIEDIKTDRSVIGKTWPEESIHKLRVRLPERRLTEQFVLALRARNRFATSDPALVRLRWQGVVHSYEPLPTLYLLTVGVTEYKEVALKLPLSVPDASAFLKVMNEQSANNDTRLYHTIIPDPIEDPPDKLTIQEGLFRLVSRASETDVVMIFLEGHGYTEPSTLEYYFLPATFDRNIISSGLSLEEIKNVVKKLRASTYIIVDSCYAGIGPVLVNKMASELSDIPDGTSPIVITSSTGLQTSVQDPALKHSRFVKALLEGVVGYAKDWPQGQINQWPDGPITLKMLYDHLHKRVMYLSKDKQKPMVTVPKTMGGEKSPMWQNQISVKFRRAA